MVPGTKEGRKKIFGAVVCLRFARRSGLSQDEETGLE